MVDTSLAALRLLELIALLFPVVALLLQLQHRVVDTEALARRGLAAGLGLLTLLAISFVFVSVHLLGTESIPLLLSISLVMLSVLGLQLPVLIVLSSESFVDSTTGAYSATIGGLHVATDVLLRRRTFENNPKDGEVDEVDEKDEEVEGDKIGEKN